MSRFFSGHVQKLCVDAGVTCPVRDGSLGRDGCAFCNGRSFMPPYCVSSHSIIRQIEEGKSFFAKKIGDSAECTYLAYFQSGTNTYASPSKMATLFEEALSVEDVGGIVIATRPDCLGEEWLEYLGKLSQRTFVMVEIGMESANDEVLRTIGRGHEFHATLKALKDLCGTGVRTCVHSILGLPGESRESMLRQARILSGLPLDVLKLHQLQILRGSRLAHVYAVNPALVPVFSCDEYVTLVADYLERLHSHIAVERFVSQSPSSEIVAPRWGVKNEEVVRRVVALLRKRGTRQGCLMSNIPYGIFK